MFNIGEYVTRKKYGNDIVFKIIKIENNKVYLKGVEYRLIADAEMNDLIKCSKCKKKEFNDKLRNLDKNKYFYIPGVVLHFDTDSEYLQRCLEYYKQQNIKAYGYVFNPEDFKNKIEKLLSRHQPNILVITGHDAYYKDKNKYKNSKYYIDAVKEARKIIKNHSELIIVSGACQSNYNGLISAGSTFASSPKHINVHALDPAIIASYMALLSKNETEDIEEILNKTEYGSSGFGGIITNGMMISGFPRKEE